MPSLTQNLLHRYECYTQASALAVFICLLSQMSSSSEVEFVLVRRRDLERLTTEVMQMREFLPQIVNSELVESVQRLEVAEGALEVKEQDCEHIRARLEVSQSEYLRAKEENLSLLLQLSTLREKSVQQTYYCTHVGSVLCTLLWSVSNREETVTNILGMDKCTEFFMMASQTVASYVDALDETEQDEDNEDVQYVLGFAGIVTNVAAVSCGRDFLITSCRELMESWIQILGKIRLGTCSRLRVLLLKCLYNVSINQCGLLWMSQVKGFPSALRRLLSDPDAEVCLHALLLFQSLSVDPDVLRLLWKDVQECLPNIMELSQSNNAHLQRTAKELLEEIGGQQNIE
ncbi:heat shock factor 2-binding protein isoform X2 [Pyxicephalus adspersus]|uniref:heat shock factor 2-binding protein isoform X2 n=1 Tax=Pyxicephalus adspersus TaxID=30357 RepID=UPI003B58CFE5